MIQLGAAYYPELWEKSELLRDIEKCKEYGLRLLRIGEFVTVLSPASFMPLYIGTASQKRAKAMETLAADRRKFYPGMPTVTYDCPAFSTDYWRGQTWLNVAFFAVKGLYDYGFRETAGEIREFLLSMAFDDLPRGISENYDSVNRRGKFNASFSWSAAFLIEFILQDESIPHTPDDAIPK